MRFGLALPQYDFSLPGGRPISWSHVRDWAQQAEELGFDSVWLSDHLFLDLARYGGSGEAQGAMECFTTLAALATVTSRVRLGSLVVCNDLRNPALVAKMAATIDLLSGGRLELGMGAGWYEAEYAAAGIPFGAPGVRVSRLAEAVQVVAGMLSSPSFSFSGEHYTVKEAWNLPRPLQSPRPPVIVGGKGERMARIAGRHADGFNSVWAWTPERYADRVRVVETAARAAGRDPSALRRTVGLYTLPGEDEADLASRWNRYLAANPWIEPGTGLHAWGDDKLCGTPETMTARIREFAAPGVEEVILGFGLVPFQVADASAVELFAREVFPLARQRVP